jgi:hypothetical protein
MPFGVYRKTTQKARRPPGGANAQRFFTQPFGLIGSNPAAYRAGIPFRLVAFVGYQIKGVSRDVIVQ